SIWYMSTRLPPIAADELFVIPPASPSSGPISSGSAEVFLTLRERRNFEAWLNRMRTSHVLTDERPSKAANRLKAPRRVSCRTSSASALLPLTDQAKPYRL